MKLRQIIRTRRRWLIALGVLSVLALVPVGRWLNVTKSYRAYIDTAEAEFRQGVVH
jgi:hypothetical protein